MKIRDTRTKKVMSCAPSTWENIVARGKDKLFEIVENDTATTPIAVKREVTEVQVPPMPPLPEHKEIQENKTRRKKKHE